MHRPGSKSPKGAADRNIMKKKRGGPNQLLRFCALEKHTYQRDHSAGGDVENKMQNMPLPVIPKLVRACDSLELRAKMGGRNWNG